ncbi:MAG: YggS family pyridoxal phosphate-dependent enzyme [Chloroflexota bacterium]
MYRRAEIEARAAAVRERIRAAGGDPERVALVAVSKGRSLEDCRAALEAGLTGLGENRVAEALPKLEALPGAEWHLVGHLQTNKVRAAAGRFALIHSVDSLRLAEAIARRAPEQAVLLQVNTSRELQKQGLAPEAAVEAVRAAANLLPVRGLMCMAAAAGDPGPAFDLLRGLRDQAEQELGVELPVLSMGMSDDYEAAVRAGSTMLRLGRVLFDR